MTAANNCAGLWRKPQENLFSLPEDYFEQQQQRRYAKVDDDDDSSPPLFRVSVKVVVVAEEEHSYSNAFTCAYHGYEKNMKSKALDRNFNKKNRTKKSHDSVRLKDEKKRLLGAVRKSNQKKEKCTHQENLVPFLGCAES